MLVCVKDGEDIVHLVDEVERGSTKSMLDVTFKIGRGKVRSKNLK